jgi:hypothetical protein
MIVSAAFATRIVDVSTLSLFNTGFEPDSPGTNVFVDPAKTIRDYVNNPTYRRGNIIQLSINLTTDVVTDLYAYQIDVTWNPAVLNFSNVHVYGDLLARTGSPYGTSRIEPTWTANNTAGSASIAEAILGDYPGITGSGRLVTLNFTVNGYGWSNITITVGGDLPTMLLNSAGTQLSFTMTIGYFDNKLRGDVTGDRVVNINDMSAIGLAFGATPARLTWNYNADLNKDNVININDMSEVGLNFGRQTSLP